MVINNSGYLRHKKIPFGVSKWISTTEGTKREIDMTHFIYDVNSDTYIHKITGLTYPSEIMKEWKWYLESIIYVGRA